MIGLGKCVEGEDIGFRIWQGSLALYYLKRHQVYRVRCQELFDPHDRSGACDVSRASCSVVSPESFGT